MTTGEIILGVLAAVITLLGTLAVFKGNGSDRIDKKRETEITRLDKRLDEMEKDLTIVKRDSRIVAGVAIRALREIEKTTGTELELTTEEVESLERTRPVNL